MNIKTPKKTIFFSIEIAARELDSKCLLALETAQRGFRVYIGSFRALKRVGKPIKSCIFFHKSSWSSENVKRVVGKLGGKFVFLNEELGVAIPRSKLDYLITWSYSNLKPDDYSDIFALGDFQKSQMEALPNLAGINVHATGWPRFDLWRDEFLEFHSIESKKIKKQHGDFYLLVSSFGAISESSLDECAKIGEKLNIQEYDISKFKYQEFKKCLKLVDELSKKLYSNEKIIVRPHTSESIDRWHDLLSEYDNVIVCHEGDISPWLLASTGTIQFGSTVAIQAAYMGIPSIQHSVIDVPGATDTPAYEILDQVSSAEEMLQNLRREQSVNPRILRQKAIDRLGKYVANLDGKLASEAIADELEQIHVTPQQPVQFGLTRRAIFRLKEAINYLNYLKKKKFKNESGRVKRSKFEKIPGGLRHKEIENRLKRLAEIRGYAPEKVRCRQVAHNLVEFEME